MASPFQRYQSGIEASTGNLVSAYGQMAQQTSATFANLGNTLAEGIKAYAKNEQENQLLTAKAQGLAGNFEFLTKQIKENPELAPFAESFDPILKKIGGFETMSKAQKQALLLEAEAFQANIAPALAIFKEGNVSRTRQGVQSALDAKPKVSDKFGVTIEALPFQPDKSTDWNIQNNREYIELTKKNDPKLSGLDTESALHQIADGWTNAFSADPNLAKTDPKFRDTILRGLSDWKNLAGNAATDESGVTDYAKEAEAYAGATTSAVDTRLSQATAEKLAAEKAAGKTTTAPVSDTAKAPVLLTGKQKYEKAVKDAESLIEKDKAALDETFSFGYGKKTGESLSETHAKRVELEKSIKKREKELESIKPESYTDDKDTRPIEQILAERKVKEIKPKTAEDAAVAEFAKSVIKNTQKTLEETIRSGGNITVGDIARSINSFEIQNNPTSVETYTGYSGGGYGKIKLPSRYSDAGKNVTEAAQKLGIPMDTPMTADQMYQLNKELGSQAVSAGTKATATAKTLAELKPSTVGVGKTAEQKPSYAETLARPFDFNTRIKTDVPTERDMTYAEEKQYVRKWFIENRGGVIPESLDAVYRSIRPETDVQFMPAPDGGQVMITSKGAQYIAPVKPEKGMSDKEISEQSLYRYGTVQGNRIVPEERTKGSGIKLAGFVKGGEKNAEKFLQLHDDTVKIRTIVPQLLAMYKKDKLGRTLIPNEDWGTARSLITQLKAAIRLETIGTGPIAIAEHEMLQKRVADPTAFFALDIVGKQTLEGLLKSNEMALKNNNAGIQVTFAPTAGDVKSVEQQARIEANKRR
jgi:hypothetical protein